jgi:hypothetical protein
MKYAIKTNLGYLVSVPKSAGRGPWRFTDDIREAGLWSKNVAMASLEKFKYPIIRPSDSAWSEIRKVNRLVVQEVEVLYHVKKFHAEPFELTTRV